MFYSIRKQYVLEAEPGDKQVARWMRQKIASSANLNCIVNWEPKVCAALFSFGGRGDVVAVEDRACHLQGSADPLQPTKELQRGRHRAADSQPARPLQGVREVLIVTIRRNQPNVLLFDFL